ncbi:MAG: diacylglycerol kinase family protein [Candidatus Hatepunaea meridiana]|nr:diacylglycerol kinase family protein [Candidatus Hatepunaea meridiana]
MIPQIDIIATTISGSIKDWGKVKQLVPLFKSHGEENVNLFSVDSHKDARTKACELVKSGAKIVISAGGSGTFNAVLEGSYDAGVDMSDFRLGFLRKGSADLIGKVLQMPDEVEAAVDVFVRSIRENKVVPCDVIRAESIGGGSPPRRFVGYGGAELFGDIPYFTENRFIKYYKGILSQLFGDLGPFFVGTNLAIARRSLAQLTGRKRRWKVIIDGIEAIEGCFQALMILNGDLGPNLPFARSVPLGSGDFWLFTIENRGTINLIRQLKHAWNASILDNPERWGFNSFCVKENLELIPDDGGTFPVNVDGSTMECREGVRFGIVYRVLLIGGGG